MPINMQTKLLRVLQERSVRRVGGKENYPLKCRIISAMNQDPYKLIQEGNLRQDLFYRIAGFNLYIPPLKEREMDILELSEYYMSKLNRKMNKNLLEISDNLKEIMFNYNWPGNIRELEHFIENIMVRTEESETYLKEENIPLYIKELLSDDIKHDNEEVVLNYDLQEKLDNLERNSIITTLNKNMWNVSKSAKQLGVTRQSLIYRMKKLEINRL